MKQSTRLCQEQSLNSPSVLKLGLLTFCLLLLGSASQIYAKAPLPSSLNQSSPCQVYFKKLKVCANLNWLKRPVEFKMPTAEDRGELKIELTGDSHDLSRFEQLTLRASMPEMNHGTQPIKVTKNAQSLPTEPSPRKETFTFTAEQIFISMPGLWEFQIRLKHGSKVIDEGIWQETFQ